MAHQVSLPRVNGHRLTEDYARLAPGPERRFTVPGGSLFLLGDNRRVSSDSRTWRQPYVPERAVIGRVLRPRT